MLVVHPIIQSLATLIALYVFYLGIERFRSLHLNRKNVFRWKRHVVWGEIALGTWLAGVLGGMTVVKFYWHGFLITGTHGRVALIMVPFIIFGLVSGVYMNRNKKERRTLPLVHGLMNLIVLVLALAQVVSGWWVYRAFVMGSY
ncbi:MAG TPA: DUF4079 family protein [Desulfobacterales bacterium]|nr:DUF4079 family protein [Desulfobacterales bacterium]